MHIYTPSVLFHMIYDLIHVCVCTIEFKTSNMDMISIRGPFQRGKQQYKGRPGVIVMCVCMLDT